MLRKLLFIAVGALLVAPPAAAKELVGLRLCGASGCVTLQGKDAGATLDPHEGPFGGGGATAAPAAPGNWYRGVALIGEHGRAHAEFPFYFVPGADVVVAPGHGAQTPTWQDASGPWLAALERLAHGLEPFAPPEIAHVAVNGRAARDPQSYLRLYVVGGKPTDYPRETSAVQIVLESDRRSPWTDRNSLVLYPKSQLLVRDGQIVSLPADVADAAASGRSLDVGRSVPWGVVAVAAALAVLVGAALLIARRLPARRPVPQG